MINTHISIAPQLRSLITRLAWGLFLLVNSMLSYAKLQFTTFPLQEGYAKIRAISPKSERTAALLPPVQQQEAIAKFCATLDQEFKRYKWQSDPCAKIEWKAEYKTISGHPLLYAVFGKGANTTLILGGVHGDELTPVSLSFRFAGYLSQNPEAYTKDDIRVIVAPLVNPDGFLTSRPTRTNGYIDLNRNFYTHDWYKKAIPLWRKYGAPPRIFPGYFPNTEIETIFQGQLIAQYAPIKILSSHAPLGFLNYDGPGSSGLEVTNMERQAKEFVRAFAQKSHNFRVVDYTFFPGSLGNYAGRERKIPTITLELENSMPSMAEGHWKKFLPGYLQSIQYRF